MTDKPQTTSEDFKKGVRAAFDYMLSYTANNYHMNQSVQKHKDEVNEILNDSAFYALAELAPEDMSVWKTLDQMYEAGVQDGKRP